MEDAIDWEEVEESAKSMFRTWTDRGDLQWAKECWGHFQAAGLAGRSDLVQETRSKLRLLTLAWYYLDFCLYKWDEGYDDLNRDIHMIADSRDYNPIVLGSIATSIDTESLDGTWDEARLEEYALQSAVRVLRSEVYDCLLKAYGDVATLYTRMCETTRSPKPISTNEDEEEDFGDRDSDFEATGYNLQAYHFVSNGFQL